MASEIDLHIHTNASQDGELTPREVFEEARRLGIRAIAFADHDSVASVDAGVALSREFGVDFAPCVEITTKLSGCDPHLLGYFIDWRSARLDTALGRIGRALMEQARSRVERLRSLGFQIDFDDVRTASEGRHPTTAAIVSALRLKPGNLADRRFTRYVRGDRSDSPVYNFYRDWFSPGTPAFVELDTLTTPEAVALVHSLGGVAVMAHPGRTPAELVDEIAEAALDGLEVFCSTHTPEDAARFGALARARGLLMTAGSDFHGPSIKPDIRLGELSGGTHAMFDALRERALSTRRLAQRPEPRQGAKERR